MKVYPPIACLIESGPQLPPYLFETSSRKSFCAARGIARFSDFWAARLRRCLARFGVATNFGDTFQDWINVVFLVGWAWNFFIFFFNPYIVFFVTWFDFFCFLFWRWRRDVAKVSHWCVFSLTCSCEAVNLLQSYIILQVSALSESICLCLAYLSASLSFAAVSPPRLFFSLFFFLLFLWLKVYVNSIFIVLTPLQPTQ